jgi:transposase
MKMPRSPWSAGAGQRRSNWRFSERPAARLLDAATLSHVHQLFGTVAEGNTVVIQQELAKGGTHVEPRTLQRAVAALRQEQRAAALATVRLETPPGQQIQIDFGEKVVRIGDQSAKVFLMIAVLGCSRRLYCRGPLAQRQDDWFEGRDGAFRHFGGTTEQVLRDNASPLVVVYAELVDGGRP